MTKTDLIFRELTFGWGKQILNQETEIKVISGTAKARKWANELEKTGCREVSLAMVVREGISEEVTSDVSPEG